MKKALPVMLVLMMIPFIMGQESACTDKATEVLVRSTAIEIGCTVKQIGDTELDRAFRNLYDYYTTGNVPQDAIDQLNEQLSKAFDARPTLGLQIANLVNLLGVRTDEDGQILELIDIPPNIVNAVATGYDSGYNICEVKE